MSIDQKLARMVNRQPNSIYITFNDHWSYYESIESTVSELHPDDFVSLEDRQRCIDTNSLWHVRWYVKTPIGSIEVYASSLELALDHLLSYAKANRAKLQ